MAVGTGVGTLSTIGTTGTGARTTGCTLDAQARLACLPNPDSLVSFNPLEQINWREVYIDSDITVDRL